MDYYNTLGISRSASIDEIKRAYRTLAAKHHPDRGGDTARFQEIQAAYDVLSDPAKRQQYDNPQPQGFQQFGGFPPGFEQFFSQFGPGFDPFADIFGRHRQPPRNRTLNLTANISLEDAYLGKDLLANVRLPSGLEQVVEVKIPPGVKDGTVLRLAGMGDDSVPNMPRGDIHLTIQVMPHHLYERHGDDLKRKLDINCFEAILGKIVKLDTIDGKQIEVSIPPGTQHGQILAVHGYGMPNMADPRMKARLLLEINITIPTTLTSQQKDLVRQLLP